MTTNQQPYCRMCGKPIAKATIGISINKGPRPTHVSARSDTIWIDDAARWPKTWEDCERLTNAVVTSVRYVHDNDWNTHEKIPETKRVWGFRTWDGESYVDKYFCNGTCRDRYAYTMVRQFPNHGSLAWREATGAVETITKKA